MSRGHGADADANNIKREIGTISRKDWLRLDGETVSACRY